MDEIYTERETLHPAQTNLTKGEQRALNALRKALCLPTRAAAIRWVLHDCARFRGLLGA